LRTTRRFAQDKDANEKIIQPEHQRIEGVEILSVIKISYLIGVGIEGSPFREVSECWTMSGEFLFRESQWSGEQAID